MKIGMLWFDNDPKKDLRSKVIEAADYYRQKYGTVPNTCLVNSTMLTETMMSVGVVTVRPWRTVTPGHLWIGLEDENE